MRRDRSFWAGACAAAFVALGTAAAHAEPPAPAPSPVASPALQPPSLAVLADGVGGSQPLQRRDDSCCGKWTTYGDLRLRYEYDWDSRQSDGTPRDDRQRLRARARLGVSYEPDDNWKFDVRARTGAEDSQQSPHLTFADLTDGEADDFYGGLDRYYVRAKHEQSTWWAGRFDFPFWKQNEMFWDDDVTPTGIAMSLACDWQCGTATSTVGAFVLPDGLWGLNGHLLAGQFKYERTQQETTWTAALGLFGFFGDGEGEYLLRGNGARDYLIAAANVQAKWKWGTLPAMLGFDFYRNLEDYSATGSDTFAATHRDERTGWAVSFQIGDVKKRGEWSLAYVYADIETLAVNASYAQDDWVRWGSGGQTDSSDFHGHEVRFTYGLCENLILQARLFLVEANTSVQDGNRFRIDLNYKF